MFKKIKRCDGFTLIEVLVAINLAFIGVTMVVSFYLFMSKFLFSVTKKVDTNQMVFESFYRMDQILKMNEEYKIISKPDSVFFKVNDVYKIVCTRNFLGIRDLYSMEEIDTLKILVTVTDGSVFDFMNFSGNNGISSKDIESLVFEIVKNETAYRWRYYSPSISVNRFRNEGK